MSPVEDFSAMLSCQTEDLFESAVTSMIRVILKLIESSTNGDRFDKAVDCFAALRKGCILEGEGRR